MVKIEPLQKCSEVRIAQHCLFAGAWAPPFTIHMLALTTNKASWLQKVRIWPTSQTNNIMTRKALLTTDGVNYDANDLVGYPSKLRPYPNLI